MTTTGLRAWTVEEYHRMIEAGILTAEDQVELLEGQIVQMSPQQPLHASVISRTAKTFERLLGEVGIVRVQSPITLLPDSEPEPDIVAARLDENFYQDRHPDAADILLLVEVSGSTLAYDRRHKAMIYARARIADYWILDVGTRQLLVLRQPGSEGHSEQFSLGENDSIVPLAFAVVQIAVKDLFP
ncbi:Uma2 family endonuclease [Gloeobacter violaceus]|uniref:Gll1032 protein n=1 Tax=Gloeobacter violaceus (strain ATCC 29082 / PCC 7421) TaxID=251221 RepID=Q7NLT9_GLOVI|nr:Uma2 family endonuclease [Gloeobacter violaceus]BAC88973.1 gll1032 [Gloeobacter violaceus PCC 7421]